MKLFCCLSLFLLTQLSQGADYTVVIDMMKYVPEEIIVRPGDKITWVNKDFYPHTASALNKHFNSKNIPAGKSWAYTPKNKGKFPYKCSFHPTMKGRLIVK